MSSSGSSRSSSRSRRTERRAEPVVDQGPPVDPKERTIVWLLAGAVASAAWMIGGMRPPGLIAACVFSGLAFLWALLPRSFFPDYQPLKRLVRFPIFWLGLVFLLWGVLHTINPSSRAEVDFQRSLWFMRTVEPVAWLPSGVDAPFARMNGWRMLMIHGSAWLAVCAAWVGLTRRRSSRLLLTALVLNAAVIALVGIAQRLAGNGKVLWFIERPGGADFFGSFFYRNHAGAYLNLAAAAALALGFWHAQRAERTGARSSPAVIFGLIAGVLLIAAVMTFSRGAALVASLTLVAVAILFIVGQLRRRRSGLLVVVAGVLALLAGYGAQTLGAGRALERFNDFAGARVEIASGARAKAAQATWDMAQDRLWTGWGPGAFQYHFPKYQKAYPEIYGSTWESRIFWEYAHSDPVQLLAEFGLVGFSLLVAGGAYWAYRLIRLRFWRSPWLLCLVGGGVLLFVHANFDFHFYNPAILIAWCLLWALGVQWREFEVRSARGARG